MKYFPSVFLNSLGKYDKRLEPSKFSNDLIVVEERDLVKLASGQRAVVLVSDEDSVAYCDGIEIVRQVFKFKETRHLIAEIFDEPLPINVFVVLGCGLETLEDSIYFDRNNYNSFVDIISGSEFSSTIIEDSAFLGKGRHVLLSSPLDLLDPPTEKIIEVIKKQSRIENVDIISDIWLGSLSRGIFELADEIYILGPKEELERLAPLGERYEKIEFIECEAGEIPAVFTERLRDCNHEVDLE